MKKKKTMKKVLSLLLTLTILVGTVSIGIPFMKFDVRAAGEITTSDGTNEKITQTSVVDNAEAAYSNYATNYLNGAGESTGIVIPGLHADEDYVVQGMTYYPQKDWMLVTAYHNDATYSSKVFCLDAATGNFVAMLSFLNVNGDFVAMFSFKNVDSENLNTDHGGGIAISEHNLYYSCGDKDRKIAYVPLTDLDGIAKNEHKVLQLRDEIELYSPADKAVEDN